jgi:MoaA/NifB/PqqE/SkfB family radical SAM enzyme
MRRWAQDQGCEFRYDAIIHPRLNRDRAVLVERLDPATVINLQFRNAGDRQVYREYYRRVRRMPPQQKLFECGAGSKILHVDSRGRAHPCLLWRADPYDLLTGALDDGWRRHLAAILGRPAPPGDCAGCPERGLCNYCPPLGFLETGQPGRKVAYYCALAAARQRRLAAMARDNFASNLG